MKAQDRMPDFVESYGQTRKPGTCAPVRMVYRPTFTLGQGKMVNVGKLPKVKKAK